MTGEELTRLLEPAVEQMGYELSHLELKVGGKDGVLRVFIDKPEGVGLADCEAVSRQLSAVLDVEDPLPGHYVLEVSSPGLDRKLTKPQHFRRYVGHDVRIRLRVPAEGRRNFRGRLMAASEERIEVEVDGVAHGLKLAAIESARLVPSL